MMEMRTIVFVLGVLLACGGGVSAQGVPPAAQSSDAGLMPGDLLRVIVSREPDLTLEQTVPDDGVLYFHRLGRRDVRGLTSDGVRDMLLSEYARYLVNPTIRVEVFRKVQVLGAVRKPDIYSLPPTMTISDALATAGGVLPEGRTDRVELRRDGQVMHVLLQADRTALADSPVRSGDQIFVPERSFASRNTATITTAVSGVLAIIIALVIR
jgi:polysaccharide biosynthesis/export protein